MESRHPYQICSSGGFAHRGMSKATFQTRMSQSIAKMKANQQHHEPDIEVITPSPPARPVFSEVAVNHTTQASPTPEVSESSPILSYPFDASSETFEGIRARMVAVGHPASDESIQSVVDYMANLRRQQSGMPPIESDQVVPTVADCLPTDPFNSDPIDCVTQHADPTDQRVPETNDENIGVMDTVMGEPLGYFLAAPQKPQYAINAYLEFAREQVLSLESVPDCEKTVHRVQGLWIKGSVDDLISHRIFFDKKRRAVCLSTGFKDTYHLDVYCTDMTKVFPDFEIAMLRNIRASPVIPTMTQGGPGCGKSARLVSMVNACAESHIVLACNRDTAQSLKKKLPRSRVYTIDAYLMHHRSSCSRLFIDEVTLAHPGKVLIAVAMSTCSHAHGFGDALQIGYINFTDIPVKHKDFRSFFPVVDELEYSYRVPSDIAFAINGVYSRYRLKPIRSLNYVPRTTIRLRGRTDINIRKGHIVLVFCREDKDHFTRYKSSSSVYTVHEYQGNESDHIILVCTQSSYRLQNSMPHVIVALTRHRKTLTIYNDYEETTLMRLVNKAMSYKPETCGGYREILSESQVLTWIRPQPCSFMTVPRTSKLQIPAQWNRKRTLTIRAADIPERLRVEYGRHCVAHVSTRYKYAYRDLPKFLERLSALISGRKILLQDCVFPIQSHLVVRIINTFEPDCVTLSSTDTNVVSNEVLNLAHYNGLDFAPELKPLEQDELTLEIADAAPVNATAGADIAIVQNFVDAFVTAETSRSNTEFMEYQFHNQDMAFPMDDEAKFRFNNLAGVYEPSAFDCMRPAIATPVPRPQKNTTVNSIHSILKRNANVPSLNTVEDSVGTAARLVDSLLDMCPGIVTSKIMLSPDLIQEWLDNQPDRVLSQLDVDCALASQPIDWYSFSLKRLPKPDLTPAAASNYPACQTILCQDKSKNAIFCPVFQVIRDRIMACMSKKIAFFTKIDDTKFGELLTSRLPPSVASSYNVAEFDMSKYDKSQGLLVLLFECMLLERLGAPTWFCKIWYFAHANTTAHNFDTKVSFRTWYQRKSGDASTYIGNTLVLLMAILDVLDFKEIALILCSGDDSLVWTTQDVTELSYSVLSTRYNFEVKLFQFHYHYFCSKFILDIDNRWCVIPDPLKRAIKLGRHDLSNREHVEEYRISYSDNVKIYGDSRVAIEVSKALSERYCCTHDATLAVAALYNLREYENFHELFHSDPGDVLCDDPSRALLEI